MQKECFRGNLCTMCSFIFYREVSYDSLESQ